MSRGTTRGVDRLGEWPPRSSRGSSFTDASKYIDEAILVVALDGSEAMLARARENVSEALLLRVDLLHLPFREASFDVVTCALALTHVAELRAAFDGLAHVLAPGGTVVVSDIHPVAVATGGHAFFRREDGSRGVTRNEIHWPRSYVDAATAAGLVVERCVDVLLDEAILQELSRYREQPGQLGEPDDPLDPIRAVPGLPFASVWVFRSPG